MLTQRPDYCCQHPEHACLVYVNSRPGLENYPGCIIPRFEYLCPDCISIRLKEGYRITFEEPFDKYEKTLIK